ncbi:uncharacterized protein LOC133451261 [Cololabis saira]|uniref:uncharacterized protein LOC133451261 n=1 Tax=Cololabis saira TaxID=129043 RepID=UPI002AD34BB2|nr:uncharacterized protein LOC133451261 [Cololabis saira]
MDEYNPERDAEDADKLLYADISNITSVFGLDSHPTKVDHCDLLLNAIDAQLDQLQVQLPKCNIISRQHDRSTPAALRWSQPPSKEIGLGRTALNDDPMSGLDLMQMPTMEQKSENKVGHREGPVTHKETNKRLDRITSDKEESQCRTQQVTWRLERLLGGVCEEGKISQQTQSPSDSICTEDFVSRFKEEMVELSLSDGIQQISSEENAETTDESGSDTCLSDQHQPLFERGKSPSDELGQGQHHRKCLSENHDVNMSHLVEDGELEKRSNTPQRSRGNNSGMPVWSFGSLSIESDFDTDSTDRIRKHTDKLTSWNSLLQCVTDMKDHRSNQNDPDTPTQAESEALAAQGEQALTA